MTGVLQGASEGFDPNAVGPGLPAFLATFVIVVVTILLLLNMSGRLRRMRYREEAARRAEEDERQEGRRHQGDDVQGRDGAEGSAPGDDPRGSA